MKISGLFGKRVESVYDGSGYVLRVNTEGNVIAGLTCVNCDEQEFYIPVNNIRSIKNTVVYTHAEKLSGNEKSVSLGRPVYDCDGMFLGRLTDIVTEKYKIVYLLVGNKKFSADDAICGDGVIIKNSVKILKSDVIKNGKVIFRRGTPVTDEVAKKAQLAGEYVQTNLKTIN